MHGHDDGPGGHAAAAPCDRLCTAVHLRSNQRNLPMDVTEFVETVQRECAQEGTNLRETWLHRAEETVNDFHMSLIKQCRRESCALRQELVERRRLVQKEADDFDRAREFVWSEAPEPLVGLYTARHRAVAFAESCVSCGSQNSALSTQPAAPRRR